MLAKTFEKVLASTPDHAHALYHIGLIEERLGQDPAAARHLAAASAADLKSFPIPLDVSQPDFAAHVQRAVAELPDDVRRDLGGIKVEAADLPDITDLVAEKPPLSPTILGSVSRAAARLHRPHGPDARRPRRQGAGPARARRGQRRDQSTHRHRRDGDR